MKVLQEYWVSDQGYPSLVVDIDGDPVNRLSFYWEQKPALTKLKVLAVNGSHPPLQLKQRGLGKLREIFPGRSEIEGLIWDPEFYDKHWIPFAVACRTATIKNDSRFVDG